MGSVTGVTCRAGASRRRSAAALVCLALVAGCGGGPSVTTLSLDVKTDFAPRVDFTRVETVVWSVDASGARHDPSSLWLGVGGTEDFTAGVRVGELVVPSGMVDVITQLVGPRGEAVAERITRLTTGGGTFALTVVLTRSCAGVVCGATASGLPGTCVGGRCVDPTCMPGPTTMCGGECSVDGDCAAGGSACTVSRCVDGACFRVPDDARCSSGEHCEVSSGCVSDAICAGGCNLAHATATCTTTGCAVSACDGRWHDCDGAPENGCECPVESCRDVARFGLGTGDGFYALRTRFDEDADVWCDMTFDGGGWALLMNVPMPAPSPATPLPVVDRLGPTVYGRLSDTRIAALVDAVDPFNNVRLVVPSNPGYGYGPVGVRATYPSFAIPVAPVAFHALVTSDLTSTTYTRLPVNDAPGTAAPSWSFVAEGARSDGSGGFTPNGSPFGCAADRGCFASAFVALVGATWAR